MLSDNYIIVLQYANQGNLRNYLKKNFPSLQWEDKVRMALDITCGLKYLHFKQIIHRDLVIYIMYFLIYITTNYYNYYELKYLFLCYSTQKIY